MMIRKSLAITLALLVAYQAWLWRAQPVGNHTLRGLHDMVFCDGNIIRAQRYLHGRHDQPIVFVGTSLTAIMEPYLSDPDVACLGMPGMSVSDGLWVIERSGAHPKLVMIEINLLQRGPSKELLDEVLQPELFWLHDHFSATRHEYQPANLFVPWLDAARRGERLQRPQVLQARPLPPDHVHALSESNGRFGWMQIDVENAIRELPRVYELAQRVRAPIGLYQLPEHRDINRSPAMKQLREAVQECFHQPVLVNPDDQYCTDDGEHMSSDDACACAYFLLQYARQRCAAPPP